MRWIIVATGIARALASGRWLLCDPATWDPTQKTFVIEVPDE